MHNYLPLVLTLASLASGPCLIPAPAAACDLCGTLQGFPLSAEVHGAKMVVYGHVTSARFGADGITGTSELKIEETLKVADQFKDRKTITLARWLQPDPKTKFLIFLDVTGGQLDAYRGLPAASPRIVQYVRGAPAYLDPKSKAELRAERLLYFFKHLSDADPDIAGDAFKEWAQASNREVGLVATKVSAASLREWFVDRKTPPARLGLYAYLLGACGNDKDAEMLRGFILSPDERTANSLDGMLAGYIHLRPQDGWKLTQAVISDSARPFTQRHAVLRMLRFYYGFDPDKHRDHVLKCAGLLVKQADIQDLAIDHLRNWKLWEYTDQILALYGTKDASAPITKRAIIRYALTCPLPQAKKFVERLRKEDPELVNDVDEGLQIEAGAAK